MKLFQQLPIKKNKSRNMPLESNANKKATEAFEKFGKTGLDKYLSSLDATPYQKAIVYTEIAKSLRKKDPEVAAILAGCAWREDPKHWRLKWLAFRLYDAKKLMEAEALIKLLNLEKSEDASENKKIYAIRLEARKYRTYVSNIEKKIASFIENGEYGENSGTAGENLPSVQSEENADQIQDTHWNNEMLDIINGQHSIIMGMHGTIDELQRDNIQLKTAFEDLKAKSDKERKELEEQYYLLLEKYNNFKVEADHNYCQLLSARTINDNLSKINAQNKIDIYDLGRQNYDLRERILDSINKILYAQNIFNEKMGNK